MFKRTSFKAAAAALTLGAAATVALPAQAQYRYDRGDRDKAALVAGIAGLAIGAAIGSSSRRDYGYSNYGYAQPYDYHNRSYRYGRSYGHGYNPGYYNRGHYGYSRRTCVVRQRVFDPYLGRYVRVRQRVPC